MLKEIARKVLADELFDERTKLYNTEEQLRRAEEIIRNLADAIDNLKHGRGYMFKPENLTEADQRLIAKNLDNEVIVILKKLFKAKADENADLLIHFPEETIGKRMGWSIGVRMYDDLVMQLDRCDKILRSKEAMEEAKKKYKR
jgi:hypothetical protein